MILLLRRTLVLMEERQQDKEAIDKELFKWFSIHCSLFMHILNVQVSDTTADDQRTERWHQNISKAFY